MKVLQCITTLLGSGGQWVSFRAPPRRLGGVGSRTPAVHCHTAGEQWVVGLRHAVGE